MRHVIFRLDRERYGLPLPAIREVLIPPSRYSRVPRSPECIRGVINLRGRVVTVVDVTRLLGLPVAVIQGQRVVLLDRGRRDLGVLVTDVDGVEALERVGSAPGKASPLVRGVARLKGIAVTVLDPDGVDRAVQEAFGSNGANASRVRSASVAAAPGGETAHG